MMLQSSQTSPAPHCRNRARVYPLLLVAALCLPSMHALAAPYCSTSSSPSLNFGAVAGTSHQDTQTSLTLSCYGGNATLLTAALVRACLFVGTGTAGAIAPRLMSNGDGAYMRYDIYADAARSQLIGPHSSGYPLYSLSFRIAPRENLNIRIPIYGRVPSDQNLPGNLSYRDTPYNSYIRYSYGYIHAPSESDCRDRNPGHLGGANDISFNWSGVYASVPRSCRISALANINFGTAHGLKATRAQTTVVQLKCTPDAAWQASLDDGLHAQSGKRFMAAADERVGYELYSDPTHQSRWGSGQINGVSGVGTGAIQNLTIYGQVPAQPSAAPGSYQDTVTLTLTY